MTTETLITVIALVLCMAIIVTFMLLMLAGVMLKPLEEEEMGNDELDNWRRNNPGTPITPVRDEDVKYVKMLWGKE